MNPPFKPLPHPLTPAELEALRAVPKNPRDQALIEVLVGCGLRVSEACRLKLDDVLWSHDPPAFRVTNMGGREHVVPMNPLVQDALRAWLKERSTGGNPYVFRNLRTNEPLSRTTVWMALRRYGQRAGIGKLTPHRLRHTFATAFFQQGGR